ncbi:MAG: M48 family metallopeptidase [Deltaproteobacteria bacterium]|nr:M48 family metallopeptidase [Deltaproteobacteria bacterium]
MNKARFGFLVSLLSLLAGCQVAPVTGRSQLMLVSEGQEVSLGEESYRYILRDSLVSHEREAVRIVRKVGERIARAANKPDYRWDFQVINDPEMVNAFAVPGGKVAVYTGIFPVARDEAGLAVVLGHEVAHALARHAGERLSQSMLVQLGGLGLSAALGSNPQLANQVLQAYGLGAGLGVILPFSRSQESEADRIGLILMAKAGYDPRVALEVWERMEKTEKKESARDRSAPPEFLSTHPGYETRTQQLRAWIPEALKYYEPAQRTVEILPSLEVFDSPSAKAERELLKRIQAVNRQAQDSRGERAVVEAIGYGLRTNPSVVYQERQQLKLGYGQYAALRALSSLGRSPVRGVLADYEKGLSWSDMAQIHGAKLTELLSWMGEIRRTAGLLYGQPRSNPLGPGYRTR